jgi:cytochrome c5
MPNTSVRAAAEGMPEINRRRMLNMTGAALALAATAAGIRKSPAAPIDAAPTLRAKMSPELRAVIKDHKDAWAYWHSVCDCCDEMKLGREPNPAENAKWEDANDAEFSALWDVCRFPAKTPADLAAKGRYLKRFHNGSFGYLREEHVNALLLSMMRTGKGGDA